MSESHKRSKILDALLAPGRKPTYEELEARVKRLEHLLTKIADASPSMRSKELKHWKSKPSGKVGRPRKRDQDYLLVEVIDRIKGGGQLGDAAAIREFVELESEFREREGLGGLNKDARRSWGKTLTNRLIDARKLTRDSRK